MSVNSSVATRRGEPAATSVTGPPKLCLVHDAWPGDDTVVRAAWLRRAIDRALLASSLVPATPLLDVREFGWTAMLRDQWRAIREEARFGGGAVTPERCPVTAAAVASIPGLHAVRFESLAPGAYFPPRGLSDRALLTCHLGLVVPRGGDLRMLVGGRMARWAEGETLFFDAGQAQGRWNDGSEDGLVLTVELRRPLRWPGRWIADALLGRRLRI